MPTQLQVRAYLDRIAYSGPTAPNLDTLRAVHRAHMLAVPFENLDIPLKREIALHEDTLLRKIVERRRGGFCYEMNGAFAALLRELGYHVTLLSARVPREDGSISPEFDHLTLRVDLDEPWLADVGFGDCFMEPLRLEPNLEQAQDSRVFRIASDDDSLRVERKERDDVWKVEYMFTTVPRRLEEFAPMCHYHQTSPESPFTRKRLCTLATPEGRVTVSEMKLISTREGIKTERALASAEEWRAVLKEKFGVVL
jgi:N-hydroxyarylamine O-acetyltransferase